MLFNADGSPMMHPQAMQIMKMLAKMGTTLAPGHFPMMLVAAKLDQEEGSIQVMVPSTFLPLIQDEGFRDTVVAAVRAQLEEAAANAVVVDAQAVVEADVNEHKASEYNA
jgi:hypothetical protein